MANINISPPCCPPPLLSGPDVHQLCTQGYVSLGLPRYLAAQMETLRAAADAFFNLPVADKDLFKCGASRGPPCSPANTERGYTRLPGEKEFLTLRRSLTHLPSTAGLSELAAPVWHDVAHLMHRILSDVGVYQGLDPTAYDAIVADSMEPGCRSLSDKPRNDPPTLLRLFRYEPGGGGAEQHCDLGLLTLCICWGEGLQIQLPQPVTYEKNVYRGQEQEQQNAHCGGSWIDAPQVTVMTGDTLHVLTSRHVPSAKHRVIVNHSASHRRSIVFALRATTKGDIDLTPFGFQGTIGALELYNSIRKQRVNINADKERRNVMRTKRAEFLRLHDELRGGYTAVGPLDITDAANVPQDDTDREPRNRDGIA